MVKLGFICEGATEKILVDSPNFKQFLEQYNCQSIGSVDASGNGNLLPKNIQPFIKTLRAKGAEKIFILTDLDSDLCITLTKERIAAPDNTITVIAVKTLESWFLADDALLTVLCGEECRIDFPELEINPFQTLRSLVNSKTGRGLGISKTVVAKKMISGGFSLSRVSEHPNCHSVKYFIKKLEEASTI